MKTKITTLSLSLLMLMLLSCNNSEAQIAAQAESGTSASTIQVIQFHSENRCYTCNKIEELTRGAIESFTNVTFTLVNVDDPKNEILAEKFQAAGTALFLFNPKTGAKKDLTDFAFMNVGNKEKFVKRLNDEINSF